MDNFTFTNRQHKDRLFTFLFGREENKEWTLSLYNAVNGSDYKDPSLITFNTIQDYLYMSMKNDTSFLLLDQLSVYEHQSTYNPNMPLRMMEYVGHIYSGYIDSNRYNKYGSKLIPLPVPKLVVFYNGDKNEPDEKTLYLTDSFPEEHRGESDIEVRVRMLNINQGYNEKLLNKCRPLYEYSWFVSRIRRHKESYETMSAINRSLAEMPADFIIRPFLEQHRSEIMGIIDTEYDEEKILDLFKDEWIEEERQNTERERKRAEAAMSDIVVLSNLLKEHNIPLPDGLSSIPKSN